MDSKEFMNTYITVNRNTTNQNNKNIKNMMINIRDNKVVEELQRKID